MNRVFFGGDRIGRLEYFFWQVGLVAGFVVIAYATSGGDMVARDLDDLGNRFLLSIPLIWLQYAQAVRRAHDRNHTGWLVLLYFFPILNIALWIYLQFFGSYETDNRWGPPAERRALSLEELAQAKAILAQEEAAQRAYVEKDLLTDDGSFDMDGLFKSNPALRGDAPDPTPSQTSTLPPPPPPPPPPPS